MKSFCVHQIETDLYDGWYLGGVFSPREIMDYWQTLMPEFHHEIVLEGEGPSPLPDAKCLNQSQLYKGRLMTPGAYKNACDAALSTRRPDSSGGRKHD